MVLPKSICYTKISGSNLYLLHVQIHLLQHVRVKMPKSKMYSFMSTEVLGHLQSLT